MVDKVFSELVFRFTQPPLLLTELLSIYFINKISLYPCHLLNLINKDTLSAWILAVDCIKNISN